MEGWNEQWACVFSFFALWWINASFYNFTTHQQYHHHLWVLAFFSLCGLCIYLLPCMYTVWTSPQNTQHYIIFRVSDNTKTHTHIHTSSPPLDRHSNNGYYYKLRKEEEEIRLSSHACTDVSVFFFLLCVRPHTATAMFFLHFPELVWAWETHSREREREMGRDQKLARGKLVVVVWCQGG